MSLIRSRHIMELNVHAQLFSVQRGQQKVFRGCLETILDEVDPEIERTALILVGNALETENFDDSRLYAKDYDRRYRPQNARSFIGNEKE